MAPGLQWVARPSRVRHPSMMTRRCCRPALLRLAVAALLLAVGCCAWWAARHAGRIRVLQLSADEPEPSVFHALFPAAAGLPEAPTHRAHAVPHHLHQSWKTAAIPSVWAPYVRSWVKLHPRWSYTFYSDEALQRFMAAELPEFLGSFEACDPICKADLSRLGLMYVFGGVYADMDFEALKAFDSLVDPPSPHEALLAKEPELHARLLEGKNESFVCNALLVSRPGHPFWRHALERCAERIAKGNVGYGAAGPWAIARIWGQAPAAVKAGATVLPEEVFYPQAALWNLPKMVEKCQSKTEQAATTGNAPACAQLEADYGITQAVADEVMALVRRKKAAKAELKSGVLEMGLSGDSSSSVEARAAKEKEVDNSRAGAARVAMAAGGEGGGGRFTEQTYAQHRWHCSWCNGVDESETVAITELVPAGMLTVY